MGNEKDNRIQEILSKLEAIQVHLLTYKEYRIEGFLEHTENMLWELIEECKESDVHGN